MRGQQRALPDAERAAQGRPAGSVEADNLARMRENVGLYETLRDQTFTTLASLVQQQLDLPQALIEAQAAVWQNETQAQLGNTALLRFGALFTAEVAAARNGRAVSRPDAFRRLLGDIGD